MNDKSMRGLLVTLEGPDGGGKTTQLRFLHEWLTAQGYPVVLTREPGGTQIGERIRALVHDCALTDMSPTTEILLYSASRAQLVAEVIYPALADGKLVLCDRYYDSTYAYQGYGRGLSLDDLRTITMFATQGLKPDITLYLDIPPELGLQRREQSGEALNRLDREALAFHQRVRAGYYELLNLEPERWCLVDASGTVEAVQSELRAVLKTRLEASGFARPRT